jgi:hypothetical protein
MSALSLCAVAQDNSTRFRRMEPNVYAPNLYADHLKLKLTLINLPGAGERNSSWEVSYQLYFIPESAYMKALKRAPQGGWNPTLADFPEHILLGRQHLKRASLYTLSDRTFLSRAIPLKAKVPDKQRTKFATILTSYTVKIFDARLKSTIYRTGLFVAQPFTSDSETGGKEVARTLLYANFYVNPDGQLFYSQRPRNSESTTWP